METNNLFVKDSSHYLDGDLIDILDFRSDDLKIDKKNWKNLSIYYINYISSSTNKQHMDNSSRLYLFQKKMVKNF